MRAHVHASSNDIYIYIRPAVWRRCTGDVEPVRRYPDIIIIIYPHIYINTGFEKGPVKILCIYTRMKDFLVCF